MHLRDLPPDVQVLGTLGNILDQKEWPDYQALGICQEHIPALIEIVQHTYDFWQDLLDDDVDPRVWAPMHAWRALGQLQALQAMPVLLDVLQLIEEADADLIQEELPDVFAEIGPPAVPTLTGYLVEPEHELWARIAVAEGLQSIARKHPHTRDEVLRALLGALEGYRVEDTTFNGFMVYCLMNIQAVESAPLVEEAFLAGKVDETILGDWEDFQIGIGLLEHRLNPRHRRRVTSALILDGPRKPEEIKSRAQEKRDGGRPKAQRRDFRVKRKKARKRKR